jgi:hypothetical protein
MRLNHAPNPNPTIGYFVVSIPLASACQIMAMILTAVGAVRFLKYQKHMALGAALSGGWELCLVSMLTFSVSALVDELGETLELMRSPYSCFSAFWGS